MEGLGDMLIAKCLLKNVTMYMVTKKFEKGR